MGKKKKEKKLNPKKEKYAKFRKEKPSALSYTEQPDLTEEQIQQRREDEKRIDMFLRRMPRYSERFVNDRKAKSKR